MELLIENFLEKYGLYLFFVGLGLLFRYALLRYVIYDGELRAKKIVREIIVVIIITILWSSTSIDDTGNTNDLFVIVMLFLGYCFYALMKKIPECGYSESILLLVNGFMVTALSFMSFPENIVFILIIIIGSTFAIKYWFGEKKSDFWEIVLLCGEALLISLYMFIKKVSEPIEIAMIVLFLESFVFMLNCFIKYFIVWICSEDTEDYWNKLMGLE